MTQPLAIFTFPTPPATLDQISLHQFWTFSGMVTTSVPFLSLEETSSMDDPSIGFSWTRGSAFCKQLINLQEDTVLASYAFMISMPLPYFHKFLFVILFFFYPRLVKKKLHYYKKII